jgi:hypothetical protein
MGQLTQSFVRDLLVQGFGADPKFVVPKQGNWWNPQDRAKDGQKPATWCAYRIASSRGRSIPFYQIVEQESPIPDLNVSTAYMISVIEVQLIGELAEVSAMSIAHWLNREDLKLALDNVNAQFMASGLGDYIVSNYSQDGENTVLAYNSKIMIQWASTIDTAQVILNTANLSGNVIVTP